MLLFALWSNKRYRVLKISASHMFYSYVCYLLPLIIIVYMVAKIAMNKYVHRVVFIASTMFGMFFATTAAIDVLIAYPRILILPRKALTIPYSLLGEVFNCPFFQC